MPVLLFHPTWDATVVDATDRWLAADRSVGAVMVVQVQLGVQSISSLGVSPIGPLVGPLGQQDAVDAFDLAVVLKVVGGGRSAGPRLDDSGLQVRHWPRRRTSGGRGGWPRPGSRPGRRR